MKTDFAEPILEITFRDNGDHDLSTKRTVIALGTFDGVHIAHKRLIEDAVRLKENTDADLVGVWCFEESPGAIIQGILPTVLTTKEERIELLFACGADFVVMGRFEALRHIVAKDFIKNVLVNRLGCIGTVCGYDHHFGYMGLGNASILEYELGQDNTVTVPEITLNGETVGSSAVRKHLACGEVETANAMLGRAISINVPISEGKKLGRQLGFPTANQLFPENFAPMKNGVYATRCIFHDGSSYMGVSNVGVRPSIESGDDHKKNCETYIIDFSGELYGRKMKVEFCAYLREEKKFSSLEELTRAIKHDCERTVQFFTNNNG